MRGTDNVADMTDENFTAGVRKPAAGAQNEKNAPAEVVAAVRDIANEDDVRAALFALDDDALDRLELRAAAYRQMLPAEDVQELVNETLRRVLDGCRTWPKNVPFMAFLFECMRSLAWQFGKRNRREIPESRLGGADADEEDESYLDMQPPVGGDPEDATRVARFAGEVERMFEQDDEVMAIIIGRIEGLSADETRERFDMTTKVFEAAQKRLRRAVLAGRLDSWR
jgi:DNA-directed RNA polymerase specialized sigma24 family protein